VTKNLKRLIYKKLKSIGGIMARRSESFDAVIAEKMKNIEFARETLIASIDHFGDTVEVALKGTIEKMGIKEFSVLSDIPIQKISDFIKGKRNLKVETLNKYLAVFKLKSKLVVVEEENDDVA